MKCVGVSFVTFFPFAWWLCRIGSGVGILLMIVVVES